MDIIAGLVNEGQRDTAQWVGPFIGDSHPDWIEELHWHQGSGLVGAGISYRTRVADLCVHRRALRVDRLGQPT